MTLIASAGGFAARSQIVAIVGTITPARISAGAIVHAISSRVFPWICPGIRSRPLRWRNRIVIHTMPPSTTMKTNDGHPEDGDEQVLQLLRVGPFGLERVLRGVGSAGAQQEEQADRGRRPEHPLPHGSFGLPELS